MSSEGGVITVNQAPPPPADAPVFGGGGEDPALAFVAALAGGKVPGTKAAEPPAKVTVEQLLHQKTVEVKAKELQAREERLEQGAREDQMKSFARATKLATEAAAADRERRQQLEDTPLAREEALRQFGLLREMGVPGTGKRMTIDSPLANILIENDIMNQQLNNERATDMPLVILHGAVRYASLAFPLMAGAGDDLEAAYEASKRGQTREERAYYRTMQQLSIKYGSYFAMSPEMFAVMQMIEVVKNRVQYNRQRLAMAQGQEEAPDEVEAAMRAYEQPVAAPEPVQSEVVAQLEAAAEEAAAAAQLPRQVVPDGPTEVSRPRGRPRKEPK